MKSLLIGAALASSCILATSADAHHSFAMFDMNKTQTVTGTVSEFRWQMPHVWLRVMIKGPNGQNMIWAGECHSPNIIARKGWKSNTIKPGDKVVVTMHPQNDGSATGSVISVRLPDGRVLMNAESDKRV